MKVLVIGSGGREHALAWKIGQSPIVDSVLCLPGNPGMAHAGSCLEGDPCNLDDMQKQVIARAPDLVVIGPEPPLVAGLADVLRARGFDVFGPGQAAARLEASKGFAKDLMRRLDIPTAAYGRFTEVDEAIDFLRTMTPPHVIKADGLAGGKGVVIHQTLAAAEDEVRAMMAGKFGKASNEIVIEEFMHGEEASVFVLTDGEGALYLPPVQDHKRAGPGNSGLNTGGMAACSPVPAVTPRIMELVQTLIVEPLLAGMQADGTPYTGVLYVGIMITPDGPKVVEFNVRFGDPECQALMVGLPGDIVPALLVCATGGLVQAHARISSMLGLSRFQPTACIVMANQGYPGRHVTGSHIRDIAAAEALKGVHVFQAGTTRDDDGRLLATGGRVLGVTATGPGLRDAIDRAYAGIAAIDWPQGFYRHDIGNPHKQDVDGN